MSTTTNISFAGVDYIRVTSPDQRRYGEWMDVLLPEFLSEEKAGRPQRLRGMLGYYGRMGEHCFVGMGEQGTMAQASGAIANHYFKPLSRPDGRASRVDLQLTQKVGCPPSEYLRYTFAAAQQREKHRGKPPVFAISDTTNGARMITIGSRQSEVYGRIYDKFTESKQDAYADMVRFEIEVKGKQAVDMQRFIAEDQGLIPTCKHIVSNWFAARGVENDWSKGMLQEYIPENKRHKTTDTKLAWIATQVHPTIKHLLATGNEKEVAMAILGADADRAGIDTLAALLLEYMPGGA